MSSTTTPLIDLAPSTSWGALSRGADLINAHHRDPEITKRWRDPTLHSSICPRLVLQHLLWPEGTPLVDGQIPDDTVTLRPYWAAVHQLDAAVLPATLDRWVAMHGVHRQIADLMRDASHGRRAGTR